MTPEFDESPETVTAMLAVALSPIEEGGVVEKVTLMPLPIVTEAWADLVESVTEVAVIVTEPPVGTAAGAL